MGEWNDMLWNAVSLQKGDVALIHGFTHTVDGDKVAYNGYYAKLFKNVNVDDESYVIKSWEVQVYSLTRNTGSDTELIGFCENVLSPLNLKRCRERSPKSNTQKADELKVTFGLN